MTLVQRYELAKAKLLADPRICQPNRDLFSAFLRFEEYKLKRTNGLAELDDQCAQTLLAYVSRVRTVNRWFSNKAWVSV